MHLVCFKTIGRFRFILTLPSCLAQRQWLSSSSADFFKNVDCRNYSLLLILSQSHKVFISYSRTFFDIWIAQYQPEDVVTIMWPRDFFLFFIAGIILPLLAILHLFSHHLQICPHFNLLHLFHFSGGYCPRFTSV